MYCHIHCAFSPKSALPRGARHAFQHPLKARQAGATATEFALVFPLLFLLLYGMIVYAYVFLVNESITYVAQEAAEAAVAVDPNDPPPGGYEAQVRQRVRTTAVDLLAWMPASQRERVVGGSGEKVQVQLETSGGQQVVRVDMRFDLDGLFPTIALPLVGRVPPMPESLGANAIALLDPGIEAGGG